MNVKTKTKRYRVKIACRVCGAERTLEVEGDYHAAIYKNDLVYHAPGCANDWVYIKVEEVDEKDGEK